MRQKARAGWLRQGAALMAGLAVTAWLSYGVGAEPLTQPYPVTSPTAPSQPTATFTFTPVPGSGAQQSAATPVPAGGTTIVNGRGRVANIQIGGFTVIWTTDTDTTGQVNYGSSTNLGLTAYDTRGQGFTGQTHYVDVTGLQAGVTYFFDVVSGGVVDNNAGQHYQIKTAAITSTPPQNNFMRGKVLNPGGASPAGGALVWGDVKDANGQGSTGASQLVAALAGGDGGYQLNLNPRVQDLTLYFVYSNSGDQVELFARGPTGEGSQTTDTAATQNGGTAPQDVNIILQPIAAASATPTLTPIVVTSTPTPVVTALAVATPTPAVPATPPPPPFPTPTARSAVQLPVQLPTLREMLLNQVGVGPPTPTEVPIAVAQAPVAPAPTFTPVPLATAAGVVPAPAQPAVPPVNQGAVPPAAGSPGVRTAPPAAQAPVVAPPVGTPFGRPATAATPFVPVEVGPGVRVNQAVPTPTVAAGEFGGLAAMPAQVSLLFYGGLVLALVGAGVGVYSVLAGPGWRPR